MTKRFTGLALLFFALFSLIFLFTKIGSTQNQEVRDFPSRENMPTLTINENLEIKLYVADTISKWSRGLSIFDKIDEDEGMLFIFNNKQIPQFWMKDMKFPIDIIWIDDSEIVGFHQNLQPPSSPNQTLETYSPPKPINYVLEVNAGFVEKHELEVGDSVRLNF
jgi:uncharacterized protein